MKVRELLEKIDNGYELGNADVHDISDGSSVYAPITVFLTGTPEKRMEYEVTSFYYSHGTLYILCEAEPAPVNGRENYQNICDLLLATLQHTREYEDLVSMVYVKPEQPNRYSSYVEVTWSNGYTVKVNTSLDSGSAMIRDILKHIR